MIYDLGFMIGDRGNGEWRRPFSTRVILSEVRRKGGARTQSKDPVDDVWREYELQQEIAAFNIVHVARGITGSFDCEPG